MYDIIAKPSKRCFLEEERELMVQSDYGSRASIMDGRIREELREVTDLCLCLSDYDLEKTSLY